MKVRAVYSTNGLRIVVEIDSVERAVIRTMYGTDICGSRYRVVRLLDILNNLRATLALYQLASERYGEGCLIVLSEDVAGWNMVRSSCQRKGLEDDISCVNYLAEVIREFIYSIASLQSGQ